MPKNLSTFTILGCDQTKMTNRHLKNQHDVFATTFILSYVAATRARGPLVRVGHTYGHMKDWCT